MIDSRSRSILAQPGSPESARDGDRANRPRAQLGLVALLVVVGFAGYWLLLSAMAWAFVAMGLDPREGYAHHVLPLVASGLVCLGWALLARRTSQGRAGRLALAAAATVLIIGQIVPHVAMAAGNAHYYAGLSLLRSDNRSGAEREFQAHHERWIAAPFQLKADLRLGGHGLVQDTDVRAFSLLAVSAQTEGDYRAAERYFLEAAAAARERGLVDAEKAMADDARSMGAEADRSR